jgi:hypothetical protein
VNIQLHIERLVLDGLPISRYEGVLMRGVVERELGRLVGGGALISHLASATAVPMLSGGVISLAGDSRPQRLGTQIAAAIHSGIGNWR